METKFVEHTRKTGKELFTTANSIVGISLSDYWSWAHSDIVNNTERGKVAEFIVASALGVTDKVTSTWDSFDLLYNGRGIEVKSAAYLQSWYQDRESNIGFGIRPTVGVIGNTGTYDTDCKRQSDAYVLCLLNHRDKMTVNPLDLDQWEFYVVPTALLNAKVPKQKSIAFSFLAKNNIQSCSYGEIRSSVDRVMAGIKD